MHSKWGGGGGEGRLRGDYERIEKEWAEKGKATAERKSGRTDVNATKGRATV